MASRERLDGAMGDVSLANKVWSEMVFYYCSLENISSKASVKWANRRDCITPTLQFKRLKTPDSHFVRSEAGV
jgi:hypothetical protein